MARKKADLPKRPDGELLEHNLVRLGYGAVTIRHSEVARKVSEATGRPMSRQRIAALTNARRIEPETLATIAAALGVEPADLLRPPPG
jgi:DNA-binding Xre family transcriptional regulator